MWLESALNRFISSITLGALKLLIQGILLPHVSKFRSQPSSLEQGLQPF